MPYRSVAEIERVAREFENGTIRREDWRHAEHLTVGCFYASQYDYETALVKMRDGIFNLLRAFEIDLSKEMPYHETLTVFWMRLIFDWKIKNPNAPLVEFTNRILEIGGDKDLPLRFYNRELLFSDDARKNFVAGDL